MPDLGACGISEGNRYFPAGLSESQETVVVERDHRQRSGHSRSAAASGGTGAAGGPRRAAPPRPAGRHGQFPCVLAAGVVIRIIVFFGSPPILWFNDSYN